MNVEPSCFSLEKSFSLLMKRQFTKNEFTLYENLYSALENKVSILQKHPEKSCAKNLNSNIIRLLLYNHTIKNASYRYNHRKLPDNCNIKMHQS